MNRYNSENLSGSDNDDMLPFRNTTLSLDDRVDDLVSRLTLDEKIDLMCQYQPEIGRLGINAYKHGTEGAHGISWLGKATVYPQPIGLSCTWDKELLKEVGSAIGDEARAFYKKNPSVNGLTLWCPAVEMLRDPRWGRTEEAYGEDPCLTGELTSELVKGIQGDHPFYYKAVATLKHFFGNNNEVDRGRCSSVVDQRNMKEYYWNAFKPAIVKGGAASIMTAYNSLNGRPCNLNSDVSDVVKKQWGMGGFVVSDAADVLGTVNDHQYYSSYAKAVADSIKSGIDSITDDAQISKKAIREALLEGLITENDLDRSLKNTFRVRMKLGEFDAEGMNPYADIKEEIICCEKHSALSLKAARESIVLLKNENQILPLKKEKISKLAVIGPLGNIVYRDWYSGTLPYSVTPLEGIMKKLSGKPVLFADGLDHVALKSAANGKYVGISDEQGLITADKNENGALETFELIDWGWGSFTVKSIANKKYLTTEEKVTASADEVGGWFVKELYNFIPQGEEGYAITSWDGRPVGISEDVNSGLVAKDTPYVTDKDIFIKSVVKNGLEEAVEAAKSAETAIVFVGNNPMINGRETQDRYDITLPPIQEELIKAVYKANPNTIVVVVGSYPISINWANDNVPAILYTSHGGQEMGNAIADVLFGDYSPSGRLSMTWYKSPDQLTDIMDYDIIRSKRTYMYFEGDPLYPFGHGLTYASFRYSNLVLGSYAVNEKDQVGISVDIKNTGTCAGDEVVQLYVRARNSTVRRPLKELKDFQRIYLEPGEVMTVKFTLSVSNLAFFDVTREKFCVESGKYGIMVGRSSSDILLTTELEVSGETIPPRDLTVMTKAENYDDCYRVKLDECKEGGNCVVFTSEGEWISFNEVDFGSGAGIFEARVAEGSSNCCIDIRLNSPYGPVAGSCKVKSRENQVWTTNKCNIRGAVGVRNVYLRSSSSVKLSWIRFIREI